MRDAVKASSLAPPAIAIPLSSDRLLGAGALAALVLLAIALRLVPILVVPSLNWPDEIFQATEQAHRLVYGTGLVPWEFQLGVRSWLLPGAVTALMALARLIGDGPDYYLPVIAVACAALAAGPAACCFLWCRRLFGLTGAILGGLVVATAPDLVYLGARTLSETVGAHLLVIALYVLEPGYRVTARRRLLAGGALLGLVFALRVQLAPALAVLALWAASRRLRERLPSILAGAGTIIALAAILDTVTLGYPLASIWRYIVDNVYYGISSLNGVRPWFFYGEIAFDLWSYQLAALLGLALVGARRMPVMLGAAVIIVAVHCVVEHKEYRFVYPAILLLMLLAGIGLAQVARWGEEALRRRLGRAAGPACAAAAAFYWCLVSLQVWGGPGFVILRHIAHESLMATDFVQRDKQVCGVALAYGMRGGEWIYGSYTYLHRPVPRYWPKDEAELAATAAAFNTLITTQPPPPPELAFSTRRCFGDVCVAQRPGGCSPLPMTALPLPQPLR